MNFDLNLLRALDALLDTCSVTAAADRLNVTQPAMSRSLSRLRQLLGDPLLCRTRHGMQPTARALALREPVHRVLEQIADVIRTGSGFEPAATQRTFTIATVDLIECMLIPHLAAHLAVVAPGANLVTRRVPRDPVAAMERGEFDLAIRPPAGIAESLRAQKLFDEGYACVVRAGHPGVGKRLTLERLVAIPHLLVAPGEASGGVVDRALAAHGKRRRVALQVVNFLAACEIVARTDLIATLPRRLARISARTMALRVLRPPIAIPGFAMCQFWHPRVDRDPAHRWLRKEIAHLARARVGSAG